MNIQNRDEAFVLRVLTKLAGSLKQSSFERRA